MLENLAVALLCATTFFLGLSFGVEYGTRVFLKAVP
jgi:hypothetical protein